jgi:hypothetical protein
MLHVPKALQEHGNAVIIMLLRLFGAIFDMSGMPFTIKQAQIQLHLDSAKCGDILVQCKVVYCTDLVLDFFLTGVMLE